MDGRKLSKIEEIVQQLENIILHIQKKNDMCAHMHTQM